MMKPRSRTGETVVVAGIEPEPVRTARELPLSVIHAEALYRPVPPVEYDDEGYPGPDSNVPESTQHAHTSAYTFNSLRAVFRDRPGDLIAHDLMLLFEEGNRKATLAPDLMVVLGVGNEPRDSYKTWKEGKVPDLVIEVVSRSTWRKDVHVKPPLYEALGIAEFWLFDPLNPRLAGFALDGGRYREIAELPEGGLRSHVLGLDLLVLDGELRCRDPRDAKVIPDHVETVRMLEVAERKLTQADRERAEADRQRGEADRQRAEADRELEVSEREREQALRRVAELEELLRQARSES
ncbi:MAG: Uma2 family endonuclease [Gammaproteobacteria bacterium]|nr:Uma2 family endonuclease [Gammaproteobacteria bacterium]